MNDNVKFYGKVSKHLNAAASQLAVYLERVLPLIFDDWWSQAVVTTLSFRQKKQLEQRNITSLGGLDLAGLLRVLDQNWYQISNSQGLTPEDRHFVKEMQSVRNRWAHADTEGFPVEDIYRDLDTLQRFAVVIAADDGLILGVKETKSELLATDSQPQSNADVEQVSMLVEKKKDEAEFAPGQIVFVKSNPDSRGAVVAVQPADPENRFMVFMDGKTQIFYASQLQLEEQVEDKLEILPSDQFHACLISARYVKGRCLLRSAMEPTTLRKRRCSPASFYPRKMKPIF
ncbi:MAG: Swt1 family HEPN domain-containing protein [Kiritimatiellae bacterium]|nr:Swt1 family HEPN domain-containing protein [Kiritimatiellia bacterium]